MSQVSSIVRHADDHWQITMDTYASSAGDPDGFYDIRVSPRAWTPSSSWRTRWAVRRIGELGSSADRTSPLKRRSRSTHRTSPPSKVILGLPFYGYSWTTTGPSATASATGPATPGPRFAIATTANPCTGATRTVPPSSRTRSGRSGTRHGSRCPSLSREGAGTSRFRSPVGGIWTLGMEGNDPELLAALVGNGSGCKGVRPGAGWTDAGSEDDRERRPPRRRPRARRARPRRARARRRPRPRNPPRRARPDPRPQSHTTDHEPTTTRSRATTTTEHVDEHDRAARPRPDDVTNSEISFVERYFRLSIAEVLCNVTLSISTTVRR